MSSFVNVCLLLPIVLIISVAAFNSTSSAGAQLDTNSDSALCPYRGKRQANNVFVDPRQHPSQSVDRQPVAPLTTRSTCSYKLTDVTCLSDAHYRTFDGSCNNIVKPWWGMPNIPFQRLMKATYADDQFLPRNLSVTRMPLPSAREVSNTCSTEMAHDTERAINALFTTFAQFIDHDLSSAANGKDDEGKPINCQCEEKVTNPFCLNIPTPDMPDQACMLFPRSTDLFRREPGCQQTVREQVNQINSYLDASMIYGNNKHKSDELRTFRQGQLKTTNDGLPPQTSTGKEASSCKGAQSGRGCFLCGDSRANENMGLTSLHTLFLRVHNRLALSLSKINPLWSDDIIYHETRRIVNAIVQHITYNEFLPLLVGASRANFGIYRYDPTVDATISNEFATAAYRFGHTLVNSFVRRFDGQHRMIDEIPLSRVIFRPSEAYNQQMGGLDTLLLGFLLTPAAKFDAMFSDILQNHLFEAEQPLRTAQTKRFDLAAININRGRDHGLPTYNSMRQFCGLRRVSSFNDLRDTMEPSTVERLSSVYAHVDDIDLYIGGIAERSLPDGIVGPTFACVIARQFNDLRRGDRFFYASQGSSIAFSSEQLNQIRRVTFSNILCQDTQGIREVQINPFKLPNNSDNPRVSCSSFSPLDLSFWRE